MFIQNTTTQIADYALIHDMPSSSRETSQKCENTTALKSYEQDDKRHAKTTRDYTLRRVHKAGVRTSTSVTGAAAR